jgi:hypothetical protein
MKTRRDMSAVRAGSVQPRTGFDRLFSILEHSAGISWQQPARLAAVGAAPVAAEARDGRSALLLVAAVLAAGRAEGVEARAWLPAERDAAVVAVAPGVVAQLAEFEASARPAESAWLERLTALPRLAFALFLERSALLAGLEPIRQLSAEQEVLAHSFPVVSERRRLPEDSAPPPPGASLLGKVSHWGSARSGQAPSRPQALEALPWSRGSAGHWPSATLGLEAEHWGIGWRATGYLVQLFDQTARPEIQAWPWD